MTPRDIVRPSLAFAGPPRIPYGMGGGFPSDLRWVRYADPPNSRARDWCKRNGYWDMVDLWGNEWRRLESITKGEPYRGVFQRSWDDMEDYDWPQLDRPELYDAARERCREMHEDGYYVLGGMGWPFDTSRYLRGLQYFLMDCAAEPDRIADLLRRVTDIYERVICRYAEIGVDGVMACEDWGTQDRLLVSPACHRELFIPCFRRLCEAAGSHGVAVWLHSCGYVRDVIGDWLEAGVSVCQFDQPELHGIDFLAERFGGRMHFWCPVDIQTTLQSKDPAVIEAAAREYIEKLAAKGGGFIAGYYGSNEAIGVDPEMQAVACRAFMKYGDLAARPA